MGLEEARQTRSAEETVLGPGLETWVVLYTGVSEGDGEGEVENEMGKVGRGSWHSVLGAGLCGVWRPWEGLGLKGGGFWTNAEGLPGSHSQGSTRFGSQGAAYTKVGGGRGTCCTLPSAVGQGPCRPVGQCARGMGEPGLGAGGWVAHPPPPRMQSLGAPEECRSLPWPSLQ